MALNTEILENIGLTKSEIKVYLSLLELGSTTTGPIVDKSGASSSKIYEILDRLMQKGLVSYIVKSGTKYFEAADPKRILDYLKEKEARLKKQSEEIKNILPELELKKELSKYKSEANIYKGVKGAEYCFNTMLDELKSEEEYYVLGASWRGKKEEVQNFYIDFHRRRQKKGVKVKLLFVSGTEKTVEKHKDSYTKLSEYKFLPEGAYQGLQINIYKNKLLIFVWREKEPLVFSIEDKTVSKTFKAYFDSFWNQDTIVTKGFDALEDALYSHLDSIKKGDTYRVLGAGFGRKGSEDMYVDFFEKFHKRRQKKGTKANLLFQPGAEEILKKHGEEMYKDAEIKHLPYRTEFPVAIFPYKDKTRMIIQEKEPTIITINNKLVTKSFEKHFDSLWDQGTRVVKGLDAIQNIFDEILEYDQCDFLGAKGYFMDYRPKFIDDWEKRAIKKGFKLRNLVDKDTKGHRITTFPFVETKYHLPKEFISLSVYWIFGNKVVIANWVEKEPIAIIMENKHMYNMYKKQFELLWNKGL